MRNQKPHHYALRALCLSEARHQSVRCYQHPPVCTRFARLDWGYEAFSLSEAGAKFTASHHRSPVKILRIRVKKLLCPSCLSWTKLDWGYERFRIFEAVENNMPALPCYFASFSASTGLLVVMKSTPALIVCGSQSPLRYWIGMWECRYNTITLL
jgi:hypothetical protein